MADAKVRGQFVWHDFVTAEPQAAINFYPKFVPWKTQSWELEENYTLWVAKNGPIGGIMPLSTAASSSGAKPHWLPYIATLDIEGTVNETTALGGLVITRPTDIPNGGRYAVLADPQGAVFGVYHSENMNVPGKPKPGEFSWHEHAGDDYRKTFDFYTALFGWEKIDEHDMGPLGVYMIFGANGVPMGGMFTKPPHMPAASWASYVLVNSADQAASAAAKAGGQVINGPMEVPGGDRIAQIVDAQGAMFAVHSLKKVAKPKPAAPAAAPEPEPAPAPAPAATPAAPKPKAKKKAKKAPAKAKSKAAAKKKGPAKKAAKKKQVASKKKATKKKVSAKAKKAPKKKVAKKAGKKKPARKK
jgi:predicted enzyme related to lactoylglutathione lyase